MSRDARGDNTTSIKLSAHNTNFEFSRIGVILVKYIQINPKKSITTTIKTCSLRAIEPEAVKVDTFGHVLLLTEHTDHADY